MGTRSRNYLEGGQPRIDGGSAAPARFPVVPIVPVLPLLIVGAVLIAFLPTLGNELVNWDDHLNLTNNPHYRGLSGTTVRWMFTTLHGGHYQPLSWMTFALDHQVWGLDPRGYHLTNVLLHSATAVGVYWLVLALLRLAAGAEPLAETTLRLSALFGALFFAIHPLRVESVAWASERRDVLSGFFYVLTLLSYLRMQSDGGRPRRMWYALSVGCFLLSLLSKAWGITLPAVLLALDAYPLRRLASGRERLARVCVEKVPYVALSLGVAVIAVRAQQVEAMRTLAQHGIVERTMQAAYGLCFYPVKTLLPVGLSPLYLLEQPLNPSEPKYVGSLIAVLAVTGLLIAFRQRWPWALLAWATYAIIVSPVLGFAQSGMQIAADRYTYLAGIPFAVVVAAATYRIFRNVFPGGRRPGTPGAYLITGLMMSILVGFGVLTVRQTQVWKDSFTLWDHALTLDSTNYIAYTNRGFAHQTAGELDAAVADYDSALRYNPGHAEAYNNRGVVRFTRGDIDGAIADYNAALRFKGRYADAYANRGIAREAAGDIDGAIADYTAAIGLNPELSRAYYGRGNLRARRGDLTGAIADYSDALRLDPTYVEAYNNRGYARRAQGDTAGAIADYAAALRVAPADWSGRSRVERNLAAARGE